MNPNESNQQSRPNPEKYPNQETIKEILDRNLPRWEKEWDRKMEP